MSPPANYEDEIRRHRDEKDRYLAGAHSPIPPAVRDGFDGLDYFPPDPAYRFELPLVEHDDKEPISVETTAEGERGYLRWGEFRFTVSDEPVTLQAYRATPAEERLWVPFRDATNGEETYGAGRYLDLDAEDHRTNGSWVLDFNLAYNPFCAYSEAYECPLIPMENWLAIPIEAGERTFHQ